MDQDTNTVGHAEEEERIIGASGDNLILIAVVPGVIDDNAGDEARSVHDGVL